jgi:hypothetical protein
MFEFDLEVFRERLSAAARLSMFLAQCALQSRDISGKVVAVIGRRFGRPLRGQLEL